MERLGCGRGQVGLSASASLRALARVATVLGLALLWGGGPRATAAMPGANAFEADTSEATRREAMRLIPLDKLAAEDRSKVKSVLAEVSVFRRMPVKVVDCDPDAYLFLVRHPDVVVNIWEMMKISRLQLREVKEHSFQLVELAGASVHFQFVHESHNLHVIYGEGTYEGPLLTRPVKGRGVLVLKTGYVRETDGRYYISSRLDCFLTVEPLGAELATKTVLPLVGKTADNNFAQTVSFVSSLSRTLELNSRGAQRLSGQLKHVSPEVREEFADLAATVAKRTHATASKSAAGRTEVAARPDGETHR
jgi:hypothetical protein